MKNGDRISPTVAEQLVRIAIHERKIPVERCGKIFYGGNSIAEKLIVFWLDSGVVVLRTLARKIGDMPTVIYIAEKYPNAKSGKIIAEIQEYRKEWTSGIF